MSADSPRRGLNTRGGVAVPAMVPPQVVSDRSILDSAIGFISDVTLAHQPHTDHKDTITWARFESMADISDPRYGEDWELEGNVAPPLLLILGYGLGVQVWAIPANGEAVEVLSWRHGTVSALRVLPTPPTYAENGRADAPADAFAEKRPLMAMCDGASSCGGAGGGGSQPQFCAVNFVSLKSGTQVKTIKFKNPVLDILANRSSIVVTFHERIAVFDARTLEDRLSITTCYPSPGINPNPVALGPRWMAYSEHKLLHSKRSGGGCDGEGVASYTATVLNAAKSFGKGLRELGEQVAAGLTGTAGSGGNSKNSSFDSTSSGDLKQPGIVTIMDIKHPIKDVSPTSGTPISINGNDPFVAHFIAHSEAVVALEFDNSGMLLVTADKRGHDFHVFRIQPHPVGSSLAAVHHLYVLHRGDTSAKVQNIAFSLDSRWVAVSTLRGTTHVFPITPYGGPMGVRTHTSLHVVNKLSRFHRSAGLSADGRSSSPISHSESTTFSQSLIPYNNPTLPPYPRPTVVLPLAQLRQPFVLGSPPGSAMPSKTSAGSSSSSSSQRQRLSSLSDDNGKPLSVCAIFAKSRSWLLDPPNATREAPHRIQRKAVDSLFVMAGHGALIQYDLDTKLASNVAKEKICDDTPIELEVEAKAQWNLGRKDGSQEIMPPLTMDNWLIKDRNSCMLTDSTRQFDETDDRADSWLSQVEIITHAGPHRRLWMGPQFVFKTYNTPSGSNLSHIEAEAVEIGVSATSSSSAAARTERSSPLNMPLSATGRAAVPVLIESGSYSSIEQSPKLMDRFRHEHLDSDFSVAHGDSRLKEDLADAMRESPSVSATRRDAGRSISVVASDHAPFYDALAEHVDDDSAADSSSTVTTGYGSGYGSGSGGSSFDPTRSAAAALANALPNISSFESSSGPGPSSIEKVVNPLGTVTTITSGGMSTEVHSTDILDEVVSQLAAEDCVIHENCDEALFRPVVAIFCDEKSRVQGEEARRRQQELCKPPEVIGHKLIVPVIAKERDAELTKKEQLKLAGGKRDQSAAGEEQQQQQSKFDEMARKNKKGAAAAAGVTENVKKTGEKRGREEVQEASLPEKDAEESGKAERATEEKPKSAGKPKGKSVKDNVDKEAVEEPPMEFQRMTPKPAATAKKTTTTTTTTEKGRRSEEREVTRATTTREDHKAQEAAAKKKEKEKDVAKRAKEEKPEAKKSEKKSKEEENKAEVEEKVGDAKRETKQTADNTKQSAKTEKTALALANNSSSKAKPKTAATSEDDEVEQADKSMDEGKSVGKSVKALEKLDADEDGSKEEKEAIAMGSKSKIKTEKLNVAELTDSLIELGESERKNSASSLEGKATGVELKEFQSTVERKESKSNTVELKEPVDIYSVENTVKSSKKKMKQRQSRSASSGSEAEEVVEAMPAKTVVKKTTSERKSSAGAEVEELQTGPAHIEKKSSTSSEDSFADLADSLLENKQNIEETMYISFSEVPDRDFAEEEEGEEDFVRAQSQEELREREKSKECASKSSSDSSTTSDSSNTEKSVRVAAAGKTKATEQVKVKPEEAKKPPEVLKKEEPEAKAKPKEAKANRKKSIEEENVKVNVNVKSKAETSSEKKCLEDSTSAPEDAKRPATKAPKEEAKGAVKKQALKTADKASVEAVEEKENWKKTSERKEDDEKAKKDPVSALKDKKSNVEVSEKTSKDDPSLSPPAGAKLNLADLLKGDSAAMPPPAGPVVSVAEGKKSKKSAKAETKSTQESTATSTATATAPIVEQPKRAKKDPKDEVVKPSVAKDSDSGIQSSETCDDHQVSKKANKVKAGDKSGSSQDLVDTASTSSSSGMATALKKDKASDEPLVFVNKFMSKFSPEQKKKKKPTAVEPPMVDSGKSVEAPKSTETAPAPAPPSVWKTLSGADMISKNLEAINKSPVEDVGYPSLEPKPSGKVSNSNKKSKPSDDLKASTWMEPLVPTAAAAKGWPEEEPVSGPSSSTSTSTNKSGKKSKKAPPTSFDDFPMLKPLDALPPLPVLEPLEVLTPITTTTITTTTKVGAAVAKDSQVSLINFESPEENPALERKITPPPRGFTERNLILALCGSLHYEDETTRPAAPYASLAYESLVETSDQHYRSLEQSSQETELELELETNESNEKTSNENTSSSSVSTSGTSSASEEVIVVFEEKKLSKKQRRKKELLEQQQKLQDQQQQEPKLGCKNNDADADADGDDADADDDDEELRPLISMSESQAETFVDPMPVMMTSSGSGQYFVPLATGAAGATTSLQMEDSFGRSGGATTTDSEGPMPGTTTTSDDGRGVAASASASASGSANKLKTKKLEHKINLIAAIEAATSSSTSSAEESGVEGGGGGGGAGRSDPDTAVVAMASSSSLSAAAAAAAPLSTAASATAATSSTLLGSHVASSVGQQSASKKKTKRRKR